MKPTFPPEPDAPPRRWPVIVGALAGMMAFAGPAHAADAPCSTLSKLKAELGADTKVTPLTPGQMNWLRGVYDITPPAFHGGYPGTGAIIVENASKGPGVVLAWTRGPLVCNPQPVGPPFLKAMRAIKTGPVADGVEL